MSSSRNTGCGGLIALGLLALAIIIVKFVVGVLIATWPWWLLLFPMIAMLVLAKNRPLRKAVIASFIQEDVQPNISRARRKAAFTAALVAVVSTLFCLSEAGVDNLQWWLVPILLFLVATRLYALDCQSRKRPRFQRALCDNLFEILAIASVVLVAYTIALVWLSRLPLDDMTLAKLRTLEAKVESIHKFLEDHKPGFYTLIVCLFGVVALRIAAQTHPVLRNASATIATLVVTTVKWTERLACAGAIAASLTFLATQPDGPARTPFSLSLRNASDDYSAFHADLRNLVDIELREELVSRAWAERPPELKEEMTRAEAFYAERTEFESNQSTAEKKFGIKPDGDAIPISLKSQNPSVVVDANEPFDDAPAPTWTPTDLKKAAGEASELRAARTKSSDANKHEDVDEIAKETLDEISPAGKLFAADPVIAVLKAHYPVFGEFVDAINSSITEATFVTLRDRIVRAVTEKRSANLRLSLTSAVSQEVPSGSRSVVLNWNRFNESWKMSTEKNLVRFRTEVARAEASLAMGATAKQLELIETKARATSARVDELVRAGRATNDRATIEKATLLKKVVVELLALGKTWPPLAEPTSEQTNQLNETFSQTGIANSPQNSVSQPMTPLQAIRVCDFYSETALTQIVVESAGSAPETQKLRMAIGKDYELYQMRWRAQVETRRKIQEAAVEQQRQEQHRREQEYRDMHPPEVEHPVEIP